MRILDPLADPHWDEKLRGHEEASVFHTAAWARVLRDSYGYSCCYLAEIVGDRFSFLLPLMDVRSILTGSRGISLPFTDFCEPLLENNSPASGVLDSLVELGRQRGWKYFEVRGGERIFGDSQPAMTVFSHTLDLSPPEEALFAGVKESTRRNIRKAKCQGVEVSIGNSREMVDNFYRLNCLTRREHGLPPQPLSFFRNLCGHLLAKRCGCVALANLNGQSISGAVYLHFGRNVLYKYGASDRRFLALRPNDLLMWEAVRWYRAEGFKRLGFGRTELQHEGLRRYKLAWGAEELLKSYYQYDLKTNEFRKSKLKGSGPSSAIFFHLPTFVSRAISEVLYRHVA